MKIPPEPGAVQVISNVPFDVETAVTKSTRRIALLPAKASPDVFAAKDVQEAKNILTKYIKDTLQELSDTMVEAYETEDTQLDTSTGSDTESPRPDEATA